MSKLTCYIADDYSSMKSGGLSFYYGYEETVPKVVDASDEDAEYEWAFVVYKGKKELMRLSQSEIKESVDEYSAKNLIDVSEFLLAGIAIWIYRSKEKIDTGWVIKLG